MIKISVFLLIFGGIFLSQNLCGDSSGFLKTEIRELLKKRDFKTLNKKLFELERNFEMDPKNEERLFDGFFSFGTGDPSYLKYIDEWIKYSPKNNIPKIAKGFHYYELAWRARGYKYICETDRKNIELMRKNLSKTAEELIKSLDNGLDHVVLYYLLIKSTTMLGDKKLKKDILEKALKVYPQSFRIRISYLLSISPRWGGSYEEMEQFIEKSQKDIDKNERFKVLSAFIDYDKGDLLYIAGKNKKALEYLDKALEFGEHFILYDKRAEILHNLGKSKKALEDCDKSIELEPESDNSYLIKAKIYKSKEDYNNAVKFYSIADELLPKVESVLINKYWLLNTLTVSKYEANDYDENILKNAVETYKKELKNDKNNPFIYFAMGTLNLKLGKYKIATKDLEMAIKLKPDAVDFYIVLDQSLAPFREWNKIIKYWNQFIKINPNESRAYLERAGTYYHKGDMKSAKKDLIKASELGNEEARRWLQRYR
ncbi:DUF4034 domain-containing protein [bacterium]|nr:DUF4034 domain-containing protein [bacterium]